MSTKHHILPDVAITVGDGAGVGPELILRALQDAQLAKICRLCVYGNAQLLQRVAQATRLPFDFYQAAPPPGAHPPASYWLTPQGHGLWDFPLTQVDTIVPGQVQALCGAAAHQWIQAATTATLQQQHHALVTAPINKAAFHAAQIDFPGHTELLASLCGDYLPCMAFYAPEMLIALATIHTALGAVPGLLTPSRITHVIQCLEAACRRIKPHLTAPRIGVLALNPHAGEEGLFGTEETQVIIPAIHAAQAQGLNVTGPLVPDTAFYGLGTHQALPYDAYVAMYHDQGLIPFKMVAFDHGVNLTLGLPIIRTSPDHGTAFDIAWQGHASPQSLISAIKLAVQMACPHSASQARKA